MYQVKHESKGEMGEFDIGAYNQEVYAAQLRREFLQMLRENSADYHSSRFSRRIPAGWRRMRR